MRTPLMARRKFRVCNESIDIWVSAKDNGRLYSKICINDTEICETGVYAIDGYKIWIIAKYNGKNELLGWKPRRKDEKKG